MTIPNMAFQWVMILPTTIIYRFYYPTFLSMISNCIDNKQQGWIISWTNALLGFAEFLSSDIATLLHSLSLYAGTLCVGIMMLIACDIYRRTQVHLFRCYFVGGQYTESA